MPPSPSRFTRRTKRSRSDLPALGWNIMSASFIAMPGLTDWWRGHGAYFAEVPSLAKNCGKRTRPSVRHQSMKLRPSLVAS